MPVFAGFFLAEAFLAEAFFLAETFFLAAAFLAEVFFPEAFFLAEVFLLADVFFLPPLSFIAAFFFFLLPLDDFCLPLTPALSPAFFDDFLLSLPDLPAVFAPFDLRFFGLDRAFLPALVLVLRLLFVLLLATAFALPAGASAGTTLRAAAIARPARIAPNPFAELTLSIELPARSSADLIPISARAAAATGPIPLTSTTEVAMINVPWLFIVCT